ncbi:MAG TPA: hypothetical protein VKU60_09660 [Chloroflexota bacterium]|nr:hypothetical protein [Chloroflexota bacterium]
MSLNVAQEIQGLDTIVTRTLFTGETSGQPALSPDDYEHRFLETIADAVRSLQAPQAIVPDDLLNDPQRLMRYFGVEAVTHSFFAKMFPSYLMNVAAKCPFQDVRREIIEDCYCEEVNDPDAGDISHIDVLYRDGETLGISREEAEGMQPSLVMMLCMHTLDNLSKILPWQAGYATTGGLEAIQIAIKRGYLTREEFSGRYPPAEIERLCQLPDGSLRNLRLHAMKDQQHGSGVLTILRKYATNREIQEMTFWAVKLARQIRVLTWREQRRLARAAVGLPYDTLEVV